MRQRKVLALEAIAEALRSDPQDASKLVSDLEARVAGHLVEHEKALAELRTRAPPEAHLREMIANLEVSVDKLTSQFNSLRSKVYREFPEKKEKQQTNAMPGLALLGVPQLEESVKLHGADG